MKIQYLILLLIAGIAGCVKPPSYPIEPQIEFLSVSSSTIKSGAIDTITFSFTDGDGDIGVSPVDGDSCDLCGLKRGDSTCLRLSSFNVFLIDSRDSCVATLASANIETSGNFDALSGEVVVITRIYSNTCFVTPDPNCAMETMTYGIMLRDKAGHFSNIVKSSVITVDPH